MTSHLNTVANTHSIIEYLMLTPQDRVLVVLPFFYVYGKTLLNTHFCVGGSVVIDNRFVYPNTVLDTMEQLKVTGFAGVPSTFMILLNMSTLKKRTFPSLRYVTQAGGNMAPSIQKEIADIFKPKSVYIMYGATELSPRLTYVPPEHLLEKLGSIGIAIPNTNAFVADENGNRVESGVEGEIVGRGSNVMMGYWKDPKSTSQVIKNGTYFTGDRGVMDKDGFIFVVGRSSDILKIGGNRVSTKEIENAILETELVAEAAVIGIPDNVLGEAARAFIVKKGHIDITEEILRLSLSKRLPLYKIPKYFQLVPSLPKNSSGKIMKSELKLTGFLFLGTSEDLI